MIKHPGRITKKEARKLFSGGVKFIIVPCKCRPYNYNGSLGYTACIVDPLEMPDKYKCFDTFVNEFEYYNCNPELGYYAAFYKTQSNTITHSKDIIESNTRLVQLIRTLVPVRDSASDIEVMSQLRLLLCKCNSITRCKKYKFCSDCIYDAIKEKVGD